jgi:hypothetical protein
MDSAAPTRITAKKDREKKEREKTLKWTQVSIHSNGLCYLGEGHKSNRDTDVENKNLHRPFM